MTSLCQNVSISYECHVYENQTCKKIVHKRNDSQDSDNNSVKSSKLSLVSKDKGQIKTISTDNANEVKLGKKCSSNQKQKKNKRARCWSNHDYSDMKPTTYANFQAPTISQNQSSLHEKSMGPVYEIKKETIRPKVYFNKLLQQSLSEQKNNFQLTNKTICTNSGQTVKINGVLCQERMRPYLHLKRQEILKINPLFQKQIQSRQQEIEFSSNKKHTRVNSLTTNFSPMRENLQKLESSTVEDLIPMSASIIEYDFNQQWSSRRNSLNEQFENKKMVESLDSQNSPVNQHSPLLIDFHSRSEDKLVQKRLFLEPPTNNSSTRPLKIQDPLMLDAESTFSQNFYDENDQQNISIVQQRNFFFEKEQPQPRTFKKSISNLIFHSSGYLSTHQRWMLFKDVEEKDNRKMYSVKSFSSQNQKEYFNEYDIYMTLKTESFQLVTQVRSNSIFLNLFSVLSNNQQGKMYLIKENFDYSLDDYIRYLRKQSIALQNSKQFLQIERAIILNQINQVVKFFLSKGIQLAKNHELKTEDFVVCKTEVNGQMFVKLHSLYKFQKITAGKLNSSFVKLRKLKNNNLLSNQCYDLKQNTIKSNLGPIQKSIFEAFFH